ncbi:hypothetical protein TRFO_21272 [Tritrichomonas foetus]|uniref:Uncharacterized protein n=1 Tax=Tritrichomonas foetus TaxID=1144522 RepID=A0A1J4KFE2_9EUKA|nr:hypothetical protein TRFO_21272 [Tritrichomonas foetus]|eukprot:OHT09746.1 hypothetical protein TRFO_21272 [Tritrichomonas foetus]
MVLQVIHLFGLLLLFVGFHRHLEVSYNLDSPVFSKIFAPMGRLTFITVPHDFNTSGNVFQYLLPFRSWLSACPNGEIIIFGKSVNKSFDIVISTLISEYPFASIHFHEAELGMDNRPLIKDWFVRGTALATNDIAIFLNADILVEYDFNIRLQKVYQQVKKFRFLLMIDKTFTKLNKPIDHHLNRSEYNDYINITNVHGKFGCDIFIINPKQSPFNLTELPPFVVGLPAWDNCLIGNAMVSHATTFALTSYINVFHIEHKKVWDAKVKSEKIKNLNRIVNQYLRKCHGNFVYNSQFKFFQNGTYSPHARSAFNHPPYFI